MKKFIVIYHTPEEEMAKMGEVDPEEMKKGMEPWMAWAARCGDKLIDMGSPLMGGQKLSPEGNSTNSTRQVTGYSILEAENMQEAKSLMDGHPHLSRITREAGGCEIEVHECMQLPM